ncbi:MAG: hypothetical protein E6J91_10350 [Deltaproteobacteria bacterium]|nr:MAG: hypothetical protein E6J91_10350 [Deltaproteobacteria bacterium]
MRRLSFALVALVVARPVFAQPAPEPPQPQPAPEPPPPPQAPAPEPLAPSSPDDAAPDEVPAGPRADPDTVLHEDNEFGPLILIERIDITGNTATQTEIIQRALPISPGDVLHSSDKRLREARFKILALGYFRDVGLAIHKGSQRGQVVIEVHVVERGTLVLNRLWFGTTSLSPWWAGADIGERNLYGLGLGVGGGFVFARHGDFPGARDQYAAEIRITDPSLRGSRWGASWAATVVHGSEPYRVPCTPVDGDPSPTCAFPYRRVGVRIGATYNISALTRLTTGLRIEAIDAALPAVPLVQHPDGSLTTANLHLLPGASRVVTTSFGFDRDTRPDPILPHAGDRIVASAELGGTLLGGSYDFATIFAGYEHYWPLLGERHALAIKLAGGVVVGDAPRFDRIYIADVDRMLTPRALGMVLSTSPPLSILGTRADKPAYGDLGGSATVEYALQVYRGSGKQRLYGADVFVAAGVWGLAEHAELRARTTGLAAALPIDVFADAGLRIDTDIGVFELAIGNALGRLR